jgi:hypothetical protein
MMNESKFWEIIEQLNERPDSSMDEKSERITEVLSVLNKSDAEKFSHIFDEMINKSFIWSLWGAAYLINGGCSDDTFTDFQSSLIAKGKDIFELACKKPDSLALYEIDEDEWFFEGFQYAVCDGVEAAVGDEVERIIPFPEAPAGIEWDEDDLEKLFPDLAAKYA